MAESTLSLAYDDFRQEIGYFCSFGEQIANWSGDADRSDRVESILHRGYIQFLAPPPIENDRISHSWSFLKPTTTITLFAAPSGTLGASGSVSGTTVTITTAAFTPDDAATGAELVGQTITLGDTSGGTSEDATIASVTSSTALEVSSGPSGTYDQSDDTYAVAIDANYNLPDDFGGFVVDEMQFTTTTGHPPIEITSQNRIRNLRQDSTLLQTGRPKFAALRPRDTGGSSAGQRFELMVWPEPDAAYVVNYRYIVLPAKLSASAPYPLGGALHGETVMASCLAIAEEYAMTPSTKYRELFRQRLAASVSLDRIAYKARNLGYNADNSGRLADPRGQLNAVTYNDVQYP